MERKRHTETRLQKTIHYRHWTAWQNLIELFADSGDPALVKRSYRLKDCCCRGGLYLTDRDPVDVRLWVHRCYDRLCPLCSRYRARKVRNQLLKIIGRCKEPRRIDLTIRTDSTVTLASAIADLRKYFKQLRQTPAWKRNIVGGAYVLEITYNENLQAWHPHLHIIYSGHFYPQKLLADQWKGLTDGSQVVWVKRVDRREAGHLSKYCTKPSDFHRWPSTCQIEYAIATTSCRMVQTIGSFHDMQLSDRDERSSHPKATHYISFGDLRRATRASHPAARLMLGYVCDRYVALRGLAHGLLDLPPPDEPSIPHDDDDTWDRRMSYTAKFILELCQDVKDLSSRKRVHA